MNVETQANRVLGSEGSLAVFVAKQEPHVRCYGDARVEGIVNSCYVIFETMPMDENARSFGVGGSVPLPWTQRARKICSNSDKSKHWR